MPRRESNRSRGTSSRTASRRGRQSSSGPNKGLLFGVLGVVVVGVIVLIVVMGGDDGGDGKDKGDQQAARTSSTGNGGGTGSGGSSDDPFDLSSTKTGTDSDEPVKKRVVGREPKTVKMEDLLEHLDRLYMEKEHNAAIRALNDQVEEHKKQRWDLPKELNAEYKRLVTLTEERKQIPFLRSADSELRKYNIQMEKKDLHLRDENGDLYPTPFLGFTRKPFVFFVQRHPDGREKEIVDEVHDQLTQLKEEFVSYFSQFMEIDTEKTKDTIIKVMLLRTWHYYNVYNRIKEPDRDRTQTVAHYEPGSKMLVVPLHVPGQVYDGDPDYYRKLVMFHEGTHQLTHVFADQKHLSAYGSMWSDEGVAEYFAGFKMEGDKYIFRKLNMPRCKAVAMYGLGRDNRAPLIKIIKWTRATQGEEERAGGKRKSEAQWMTNQLYWQGWALVEFLNNYENGKYFKKFQQIMRRQFKSGDTGLPVFRDAFPTGEVFDTMEEEFHGFLDDLFKAQREKRIYGGEIHAEPKK